MVKEKINKKLCKNCVYRTVIGGGSEETMSGSNIACGYILVTGKMATGKRGNDGKCKLYQKGTRLGARF